MRRLLRALLGDGYDLLTAGGRALRRAARWAVARRAVLAAVLVCFLAGLSTAILWPGFRSAAPPAPPAATPQAASPAAPATPPSAAPAAAPRTAPRPIPARTAPTRTTPPAEVALAASDFRAPLAGRVTAPFGWRRDPVLGDFRFHPGVDVAGRPGQAVTAAAAGQVAAVNQVGSNYGQEPAGWEVTVRHPGGWLTRYRFPGKLRVRAGQAVAPGAPLGTLAAPGLLHYALYRDERAERPPTPVPPQG